WWGRGRAPGRIRGAYGLWPEVARAGQGEDQLVLRWIVRRRQGAVPLDPGVPAGSAGDPPGSRDVTGGIGAAVEAQPEGAVRSDLRRLDVAEQEGVRRAEDDPVDGPGPLVGERPGRGPAERLVRARILHGHELLVGGRRRRWR